MKKTKHTSKKKTLLIPGLLIVLVVAGSLLIYSRRDANNSESQKETNQPGVEKIDLSPATEEDKKAADQNKQDNLDRTDLESKPQPTTRTVNPVITDAGLYDGNVEVTGFIPGIIEDTGTCTIKLEKGSSQVTRQVPSMKDATTTRCQNVVIPRAEFSDAGTWKVTISYSSPTASGISEARELEIN